jgi:hypothetical protein
MGLGSLIFLFSGDVGGEAGKLVPGRVEVMSKKWTGSELAIL